MWLPSYVAQQDAHTQGAGSRAVVSTKDCVVSHTPSLTHYLQDVPCPRKVGHVKENPALSIPSYGSAESVFRHLFLLIPATAAAKPFHQWFQCLVANPNACTKSPHDTCCNSNLTWARTPALLLGPLSPPRKRHDLSPLSKRYEQFEWSTENVTKMSFASVADNCAGREVAAENAFDTTYIVEATDNDGYPVVPAHTEGG